MVPAQQESLQLVNYLMLLIGSVMLGKSINEGEIGRMVFVH